MALCLIEIIGVARIASNKGLTGARAPHPLRGGQELRQYSFSANNAIRSLSTAATNTGVAALSSTLMNSVLAFEILCLNSYTFVDIITIHPVMTVRLSIMTMNGMNPSNDSDTAPAQSLSAQPLPPRPAPQSAAQSQTPMSQTPQYVQPGPSMQPQYAGQPEHGHNRYLHKMFHGVFHGLFHKVFHNLCRKPQYLLCSLHNTPRSSYTRHIPSNLRILPSRCIPRSRRIRRNPPIPIPGRNSRSTAPRSSVLRSTSATRHNPIPLRRNHSCKRLRQCQSQCPTQCLPRCPQQCPWSCRSILAVYGARGVARWSIV